MVKVWRTFAYLEEAGGEDDGAVTPSGRPTVGVERAAYSAPTSSYSTPRPGHNALPGAHPLASFTGQQAPLGLGG